MTHRFCEGHAGFCSTDIHDALQYISLVFLSFFFVTMNNILVANASSEREFSSVRSVAC